MNAIKHVGTNYLLSAALAVTVGVFSNVTLATDVASPSLAEHGDWNGSQIAYNAKRWPPHIKTHRSQKREKADFARLEERTDADKAVVEKKRKSQGPHRRTPYSKRPR